MTDGCTVGQWLRYWTALVQHRLRPSTWKAYRDHVRLYLLPYLGDIELSNLSRRDVTGMFAALGGRRNRYGKPVSAATLERIRSTLGAALNEAFREDLIKDNPARALRLPSPRHPHAVVWTARRVAAWQETGERPPLAVWTLDQLVDFLNIVRDDRLFALWWLVALRGLRRGEAAGLRWMDLDVDRRELTISRQLVGTEEGVQALPPKSTASQRTIALDSETLRLLREQERAQRRRLGPDWLVAGPIFCQPDGSALRPDYLSYRFHKLVVASGLPPIRLHDLRHGAATLALASGADLRVVQGLLGHTSIVLTADVYTSVLPQLYHESARATAQMVLRAARKTATRVRKGRKVEV
ncbi:site-specific integrase [Nonomuraea sp. NPDC050404]|uniref:site-specific integrase n=1 Tax=Nonomuraea sp. NPDC050404 TaxID=3155783 RepID=UPI0033EA8C96